MICVLGISEIGLEKLQLISRTRLESRDCQDSAKTKDEKAEIEVERRRRSKKLADGGTGWRLQGPVKSEGAKWKKDLSRRGREAIAPLLRSTTYLLTTKGRKRRGQARVTAKAK